MAEPTVRTPTRRGPPSIVAKFSSLERARDAVADLSAHGIDLDDVALVGAVTDHRTAPVRPRRRHRHAPKSLFELPVSPAGAVWLAVFGDSPVAAHVLAAREPLDLRTA
jgi:hypothetical protein